MLAGRAAESIVFNEISTGASGDIRRATSLARPMVTEFGMSDKLGNVRYAFQQFQFLESGEPTASASPEAPKVIDEEVKRIATEEYQRAQQRLKNHRSAFEHPAHQLLETECVDGAAVKQALAMQPA